MPRSEYAERYATDPEFRERKKAIGLKSYHRTYAERYATDPDFRERKKAISRKGHQVHREKILAKRRADYAANREAIRVREAARRADPAARERARQRSAEWHRRNRGPGKHLKIKYGITVEALHEMVAAQDDRCAICGAEMKAKRRCIDHDHDTGQIRALLCNACNLMIGMAKDNPDVLLAAAAYLERHARDKDTRAVA